MLGELEEEIKHLTVGDIEENERQRMKRRLKI